MSEVIVVSNAMDLHAHVVLEVLERRGVAARLLPIPDYPTRLHLSLEHDGPSLELETRASGAAGLRPDALAVWVRRPHAPLLDARIDDRDHPRATREARAVLDSFMCAMAPAALWVNPWGSARLTGRKPLQLAQARACGFATPPTLFSSDPERIRAFARRFDGPLAFKTLFPNEHPTTRLTAATLPDDELLSLTPGIYQPFLDKRFELRVTMVGPHAFTARIDPPQSGEGAVDWRVATHRLPAEELVHLQPDHLPEPVRARCWALMQRLGLAYAAIDLVVTPDDELYFLELNESGQFLFVESHTELPITDALATMLAAGSVEFPWAPARATTWFQGELREAAGRRMHAALERHVDPYAQPPVAPLW